MVENTTTVSFDVPSELARLMALTPSQSVFERDAMLLYPYIQNMTISHGRAAEILGVHILDLIAFYGKLGLPYIDMSKEELDAERAVFLKAKGRA